jgi:hypothetical protein
MALRWLLQVLQPLQKFERSPFWNACSYGIKNYGNEVTFNGITSLANFIQLYHSFQKLIEGQIDRMTISLTYFFPLGRKVG